MLFAVRTGRFAPDPSVAIGPVTESKSSVSRRPRRNCIPTRRDNYPPIVLQLINGLGHLIASPKSRDAFAGLQVGIFTALAETSYNRLQKAAGLGDTALICCKPARLVDVRELP